MSNPLARMFAEERETHLLGLVRVGLSALMLAHTWRLFREDRALGYFGDRFFVPAVPESWVPVHGTYLVLLGLMAAGGVLGLIGLRGREGLLLSACLGLYILACDRLQYHNNRYALLLLAFLVAFTPCERSFCYPTPPRGSLRSLVSGWAGGGGPGPGWAWRLAQAQVSLVYLGSSLSKLFDPDWFGGQVMWIRGTRSLHLLATWGVHLPGAASWALGSKLFMSVISKGAIGTELFLALGLWFAPTRVLALWIGVMFHLGIEVTAHVELFSYLMWIGYVLFATPELRERTLLLAQDARAARVLGGPLWALDWLSRFSIKRVPRAETGGAWLCMIDRDGTRATGFSALVLLTRCLPALFPLWLPLRALSALRRASPARPPQSREEIDRRAAG